MLRTQMKHEKRTFSSMIQENPFENGFSQKISVKLVSDRYQFDGQFLQKYLFLFIFTWLKWFTRSQTSTPKLIPLFDPPCYRYNSWSNRDPSSDRVRRSSGPAAAVRALLFLHGVLRVHCLRVCEGLGDWTDSHRCHPDEGEPARTRAGVRCPARFLVWLCGTAHGDTAARWRNVDY